MRTHFNPPDKEAMKSKTITSICMLIIIVSLYATCYLLFFRTSDIDLTKDVTIQYDGESGSASVRVYNGITDYNQRKQEFMDSVTYKISKQENLKNGDDIMISSTYDEELADRYHFHPIHTVRKVKVTNLPERLDSADELTEEFLKDIDGKGIAYLRKNMDQILDEDFTEFHIKAKPSLQKQKLLYRMFLDSDKLSSKDRIIDIYAITAMGEINVLTDGERLEAKTSTIYYMITYNEVNTSLTMLDENIFGEKLIYNGKVDMTKEANCKEVVQKKYGSQFHITFLDLANKES